MSPEQIASIRSRIGDDLDSLYANWVDQARAAISQGQQP